ncbi:MAG: electron transfer flavoprotein subunit alpha/FixB family protein [Spirochaetes bacterium]|nr:electron transfer flavoprotein subunit alpha/FixB family protein [Spirochaetota bacterium]
MSKVAIIFTGKQQQLIKQAEEFSSFIDLFFNKEDQIVAWIISQDEEKEITIRLSPLISEVYQIKLSAVPIAENYLKIITRLYGKVKPEIMLFSSDLFSSGLAVRIASRLQGASATGIKTCVFKEQNFLIEKPVYTNNLTACFQLKRQPYCLSIAKGFKDNGKEKRLVKKIEEITGTKERKTDRCQAYHVEKLTDDYGLDQAHVIVAAGKGIGSKDQVALLEVLAQQLKGQLGASRPVVMNAWTAMDRLIGASGAIIAPEICIALAVSGAAAFAVGIEKSKFIIAVNQDEKAPIFKIADVAICDDYKKIAEELIKLLK